MAIHECGVTDDFFQCDSDTGAFDFPCCACRHRVKLENSFPCFFCGHNMNAAEHYSCVTCGELQPGNPYENGKYIAKGTPAAFGPLCLTCYNSIAADISSREQR